MSADLEISMRHEYSEFVRDEHFSTEDFLKTRIIIKKLYLSYIFKYFSFPRNKNILKAS